MHVCECARVQSRPPAKDCLQTDDHVHGNWKAHLQEVDQIQQNEPIELRKLTDKRHAGVHILAVSYSSRVHVAWYHRLAQFAEPQLEQRRKQVRICRRCLWQLPLITADLHGVHFVQVTWHPRTRQTVVLHVGPEIGLRPHTAGRGILWPWSWHLWTSVYPQQQLIYYLDKISNRGFNQNNSLWSSCSNLNIMKH